MSNRDSTLLSVRGLTKSYARARWISGGPEVVALRGVDLDLLAGRTLAILGESGAGKSTLARCIARLEQSDSGEILFCGQELRAESAHRHVQLIFQDPGASLNPRFTVAEALEEPARIQHREDGRVDEQLRQVGLPETLARRLTGELSGGQKARLALARALGALSDPGVLILDESLASLDLSVQAQMINLLVDLQSQRGLAYLLIAHDQRLVAHLADEVVVMLKGKIEVGNA